ncbi:MAG: MlaE family lipid ABC transporter permease subunit [Chitinispirillaceae bacterium]
MPTTISEDRSEDIIKAPEFLDRHWVSSCNLLKKNHSGRLVIDLGSTKKMDSSGICFLRLLHNLRKEQGGALVLQNLPPQLHTQLRTDTIPAEQGTEEQKAGFLEKLGDGMISSWHSAQIALSVFVEMLYWGTIGALKRQDFKKGGLTEEMYQLGFKALGIVALLAFLIGIVLSLQTAIQLRAYGAGVFLAPLIGITMVQQMGPLLTAIILAGRTGSATTAEIATMVVGEEIDALRTMGLNPIQYVVVPKFWAISITMPLLSIIATATGIFGGFIIGILYLDVSPDLFWNGLTKALFMEHVLSGCFKSLVFSWLIIWIGCYHGFKVRGGADAVGRETTSSVVAGIFIIIVANALFSFIL